LLSKEKREKKKAGKQRPLQNAKRKRNKRGHFDRLSAKGSAGLRLCRKLLAVSHRFIVKCRPLPCCAFCLFIWKAD